MTIVEEVIEKCKTDLSATHVECVDTTGEHSCDGGYKLEVVVVSATFAGLPLLKRHRLVNEALSELMPRIHAITIKAWTPEQYEQKKS